MNKEWLRLRAKMRRKVEKWKLNRNAHTRQAKQRSRRQDELPIKGKTFHCLGHSKLKFHTIANALFRIILMKFVNIAIKFISTRAHNHHQMLSLPNMMLSKFELNSLLLFFFHYVIRFNCKRSTKHNEYECYRDWIYLHSPNK